MKLSELMRQGCPECKDSRPGEEMANTLCLEGKKEFKQEMYWDEQKGQIEWGDEDDPNYMDLTVSCDFCDFVAYVTPKYGRPVDEFEVRLEEEL